MGVIISIINGIIIASMGIAIIKFRRDIKQWVWAFMWFESIFWRGSTYLLIIIVGWGFIVIGFFWPFWVFDNFKTAI